MCHLPCKCQRSPDTSLGILQKQTSFTESLIVWCILLLCKFQFSPGLRFVNVKWALLAEIPAWARILLAHLPKANQFTTEADCVMHFSYPLADTFCQQINIAEFGGCPPSPFNERLLPEKPNDSKFHRFWANFWYPIPLTVKNRHWGFLENFAKASLSSTVQCSDQFLRAPYFHLRLLYESKF